MVLKSRWSRAASVFVWGVLLGLNVGSQEHEAPPIRLGKTTDYRETASHAAVLAWLHRLDRTTDSHHLEVIGHSTEGRAIPLVVWGARAVRSPAAARRAGRLVVYLQANIHGGEVEGKESCLELLEKLCSRDGPSLKPRWRDRLVLLVCPIYNPDGNDAWGDQARNRAHQNGPARIGRRASGEGFDLNRDCMKAESVEMRAALANIYTRWDPDVVVDLHATNGTRHGFDLTYSPPLCPDLHPQLDQMLRERCFPAVRKQLENRGIRVFDYGNLSRRDPRGWYTFEPHGRFVTNYAGLRNRFGVLSEATSFLPFRKRVAATTAFVENVLDWFAAHSKEALAAIRRADRDSGAGRPRQLGIAFAHESRGRELVPIEARSLEGEGPERPSDPVGALNLLEVDIFDRFKSTESRELPAAYLLPRRATEVVALLLRHGVAVDRLEADTEFETVRIEVDTLRVLRRGYQGHRLRTLRGTGEPRKDVWPKGAYVVSTQQPLSRLIFHLLDPESADGVYAWSLYEPEL